ncbi:MAG: FHA domain-containing protein [Kofleriaceae bacterium]
MFLRHLDFVFVPFRAVYNRWLHVKNVKGNIRADANRAKAMGNMGKGYVNSAQSKLGGAQAQGAAVQGAAAQAAPVAQARGAIPQMQPPSPPGMPGGLPGGPPAAAPAAIVTKGFGPFKKRFCATCQQQLDKTWDACPFCAQAAQAAAAAVKKPVLKTQAFSMDPTGRPGQNMMLGWLVPLQGPHKGELYTLSPATTIGNDPTCGVVLQDQYMSGKHAEIKVENGIWVLKDLGSTNGTYVNNRRVEKHELVDSDFVKFGSSLVKFKCLS